MIFHIYTPSNSDIMVHFNPVWGIASVLVNIYRIDISWLQEWDTFCDYSRDMHHINIPIFNNAFGVVNNMIYKKQGLSFLLI